MPPDPDFHPLEEGWKLLEEPPMAVLWIAAVPLSCVLFVATIVAVGAVEDESAKITVRPDTPWTTIAFYLGAFFVLLMGVMVVHELIHLILHPKMGTSHQSVLGIWPKAGVCYAGYSGEISRNHFLLMVVAPLVVLTICPLIFFWISGKVLIWLALVAVFNALGCSFDLLVIGITLAQIPASAIMRNNGWDTYWKPRT